MKITGSGLLLTALVGGGVLYMATRDPMKRLQIGAKRKEVADGQEPYRLKSKAPK